MRRAFVLTTLLATPFVGVMSRAEMALLADWDRCGEKGNDGHAFPEGRVGSANRFMAAGGGNR